MINALSLAVVLLIQGTAQAQNSTFKVSGTVVREDNQDPARAGNGDRVLLRGNGTTTVIDVGAAGAFEFANVGPGTYQIVVGPNVSMEPVAVVVTDKDVSGLRVLIPSLVAVRGTVTVEGGGPRPRFQIAFARIGGATPSAAPINVTATAAFTAQLPPGEYRFTSSGLPAGYSLKSVTLGGADVLTQSLKVAAGDSEPITVALAVSSPPPWVKVSGRVTGRNATTTPVTGVTMSGVAAGEAMTTSVSPDGSFEFPKVLPGSYTALALPAAALSTPTSLTVGTTDVTSVEIRIPPSKEVRGRIVVQGNVPLPRIVFSLTPPGGIPGTAANFPANPQQDGSFQIALPEGERQLALVTGGLPPGYKLASLTYGTTDLLKDPFRIAATDNAELRVTFDTTSVAPVTVSGRVTGLLTTQGVRVVLISPVLDSVETSVNPDGTFTFSKVIPGNYIARLSLSGLLAARPIAVGNRDVTDVSIAYSREFIVTGHIIVEGGVASASPEVVLEAKETKPGSGVPRVSNIVNSRVLMLNLKDGEYDVSARSVPAGYQIKSIMYGTTDLLKSPLKIDGPVTWEIIVRLVPSR